MRDIKIKNKLAIKFKMIGMLIILEKKGVSYEKAIIYSLF